MSDPYYERKQVPDEFIEGIGETGLTTVDAAENRERKYSLKGSDLRRFSNPKGKDGKADPYYQRKPVPDHLILGVGETGLTKEEEFLNRERKYSVTGVDIRRFGDSAKGGFHPTDDPYYGRKPLDKTHIEGVGETGLSRAEEYEIRDNKTALFDFSSDPFQQISGTGHRQSISGTAGPAVAAAARRRSSAAAPDAVHHHHHHSGYNGGEKLAAIPSTTEDEIRPSTEVPTTTTTTTTTAHYYDQATHHDPDSVDPFHKA